MFENMFCEHTIEEEARYFIKTVEFGFHRIISVGQCLLIKHHDFYFLLLCSFRNNNRFEYL